MTGKIQKQINDAEKLKEACSLSLEERAQLIDETILEIHSKNGDFLEAFKMPINSFRGMYQVYVLFRQVDELINKKCTEEVARRAEQFRLEQEAAKRKKV